jgi:glycerophosphoryl diester phosphodiesterase
MSLRIHKALLLLTLMMALAAITAAYLPAREKFPQVYLKDSIRDVDKFSSLQIISHRGASGYLPEHSLQAYQVAIDLGTDYVEPDLCLTKDGVFVAIHDLLLDDVTNVASFLEFTDRKTTKLVDGVNTTGYFVSDFTLSEIKSLRLKQRVATRSTIFNGLFIMPTFTEIMSMMQLQYETTGRMVGIYPELKHPAYHHDLGFAMEDMLLEALTTGGYAINGEDVHNNLTSVVPVIIQCFEAPSLIYLHTKTSLPLMLLIKYTVNQMNYISEEVLEATAKYATAIGPEKKFFDPVNIKRSKELIASMRNLGLAIHPWTFRADSDIIPPFDPNFAEEERYYYGCLGVDAVFTEFPDQTRETVDVVVKSQKVNAKGDVFCPK